MPSICAFHSDVARHAKVCVFCLQDDEINRLKAEVKRLTGENVKLVGQSCFGEKPLTPMGESESAALMAEIDRLKGLVDDQEARFRFEVFRNTEQLHAENERLGAKVLWLQRQLGKFTGGS